MKIIIAVIVLNKICTQAVLLALAVAHIDAKNAVAVVQIFAPITAAADSLNGKLIVVAKTRITVITAAEDCIITVKITPAKRKINNDKIHLFVKDSNGIIFSTPVNADCKKSIPINKSPKPAIIHPISQIFFLDIILREIQSHIMGSANAEILNFIPIKATIQVITTLPTFAPKINQSELANARIPAFTNPIVNIVVVVDDCKIAVAKNPAKNALNLLFVAFSRKLTSIGPLAALSPSVIRLIPNKKSPIHHNNCPKLKSINFF